MEGRKKIVQIYLGVRGPTRAPWSYLTACSTITCHILGIITDRYQWSAYKFEDERGKGITLRYR